MKRKGKELRKVPAGDRRRLSDGRNAWRKMTDEQREEFLQWIGLRRGTRAASLIFDRAWEEEGAS